MSNWYRKYVPVHKRLSKAASFVNKLKKKGKTILPIKLSGRIITKTFWGNGWCEQMELFSDFKNRLPRGRTLIRNGSVCHLEIFEGKIEAIVAGSEIYNITIEISKLNNNIWQDIKKCCSGKISSILDLLSGKLSEGIMDIVCDPNKGIFPQQEEIEFHCSCPDWADMCKHIAAVLYGIGVRLDHQPDELFKLRGVNYSELIEINQAINQITSSRQGPSNRLPLSDISDVFNFNFNLDKSDLVDNKKLKKKKNIDSNILLENITGNFIINLRKKHKLSKNKFAKWLDVCTGTISAWESNKGRKLNLSSTSKEKLLKIIKKE